MKEEEQHVRSYLEIQQVRYKDILSYEISIDPSLFACRIPKLTLQPLVENALYHGLKLKRGLGHISVTGMRDGRDLVLTVTDDGAGMSEERLLEVQRMLKLHPDFQSESQTSLENQKEEKQQKEQEKSGRVGFGVMTVHERLQLLFGVEYGLTIESVQGEGTRVTVRIPGEEKEKG